MFLNSPLVTLVLLLCNSKLQALNNVDYIYILKKNPPYNATPETLK